MSSRVFLRPFQNTDAEVLLKWGQDDYYKQLAAFQHYDNFAQAEVAVGQYAARKYSYVVCLMQTEEVIGLVELYERGTSEKELLDTKEVGFLLDRAFEGRGYMTEALTLLFDFAFKKLQQKEIWAGTFKQNLRSQKLLKTLGFDYVYAVDLSQISKLFKYEEKYYVLKKAQWLKDH